MASTSFSDGITVILSSWLNDVNSATYTNFGNGTNYTGNLTVGSSKMTVAAASGNTVIVGTFALGTSGMTVTGGQFAWGFGATPSTRTLGASVDVGFPGGGIYGKAAATTFFSSNYYETSSADKFAGTGYASYYQQGSGVHTWATSSVSGIAGDGATMNALMTLSAAGNLSNTGASIQAASTRAIDAGGANDAGFMYGSTSRFGVFFGSGVPTLTAAKGSLYLRSDGSGTTDRAYINTNSATAWTALTTAT